MWAIRRVLLAARPELERRPDHVALFLAMFFTFFFTIVQSNLRNGQVNFLVLALCVAPAATLNAVAGQLFSTGAGAPPPARADADPSPRIRSSSARGGRRRFSFLTGIGVSRYLSAVSWALAVSIKDRAPRPAAVLRTAAPLDVAGCERGDDRGLLPAASGHSRHASDPTSTSMTGGSSWPRASRRARSRSISASGARSHSSLALR